MRKLLVSAALQAVGVFLILAASTGTAFGVDETCHSASKSPATRRGSPPVRAPAPGPCWGGGCCCSSIASGGVEGGHRRTEPRRAASGPPRLAPGVCDTHRLPSPTAIVFGENVCSCY